MDSQRPDAEVRSAPAVAVPATKRRGHWGSVPIRVLVTVAGTVVWLGLMLIATGTAGVVSLWNSALFLAPLILIGSLTRGISLATIGRLILGGGFMMGVAYVGAALFRLIVPDIYAPIRDFTIPPMEEALKLAPVAWIVFRQRRSGAWSFGATDLILLGAAAGTGFGVVETAYSHIGAGWGSHVAMLPVAGISNYGHLDAGHEIWTSIAGGILGLALLTNRSRKTAVLVGASGIVWTTLDHIANNYSAVHPGFFASFLRFITGNGWFSLVFFLAVIAAGIGVDLWIVRTCAPDIPELVALPPGSDQSLAARWRFRLGRRALAYTIFKGRRAPVAKRPEAIEAAVMVLRRMFYGRTDVAAATASQPATGGIQS